MAWRPPRDHASRCRAHTQAHERTSVPVGIGTGVLHHEAQLLVAQLQACIALAAGRMHQRVDGLRGLLLLHIVGILILVHIVQLLCWVQKSAIAVLHEQR